MIPLILSLVAGLSTMIGTIFIFVKTNKVGELITFCLSFSFIIMLAISLFDLLPESFLKLSKNYNIFNTIIITLMMFLIGYFGVRLINNKIENKNNSTLYRVGVLSLISLVLHNLPEGIAVFMSTYSNFELGFKLCIAIMLHNIPEGIAISIPLYHSGVKRSKVLLYTLFSGLIEPIGGLLGYFIFKDIMSEVLLSYILIFVAGLMTSLAVNDIIKEALSYNKYKYIKYGIAVGTLFFIIAIFL